jgi:hypothetical protein
MGPCVSSSLLDVYRQYSHPASPPLSSKELLCDTL